MKINARQELAMWILGLLWTVIGLLALKDSTEWGEIAVILLILLVPLGLVVFSLRDRI